MSRPIKFRAWDTFDKVMVYRHDGWNENIDVLTDIFKEFDNAGFVLMQFTGLLSKTGKEIYEGDIVKYDYDFKGKEAWVVEWAYDCFALFRGERRVGDMNASDDPEYIVWEMCEVIGNIYESPELIEGRAV
jgi:uncharacterized phage protein (TIGR01671 family)